MTVSPSTACLVVSSVPAPPEGGKAQLGWFKAHAIPVPLPGYAASAKPVQLVPVEPSVRIQIVAALAVPDNKNSIK